MVRLTKIELELLQQADASFPLGINSPEDHHGDEYRAFVRLHDAGYIAAEVRPWSESGTPGKHYMQCNITASGRRVLAEVMVNMGATAPGDEPMVMGLDEGRNVIIQQVNNLHGHGNRFDVHVTADEVREAERQVKESGPKTVKKAVTEWLPQSFVVNAMKQLFAILAGGAK